MKRAWIWIHLFVLLHTFCGCNVVWRKKYHEKRNFEILQKSWLKAWILRTRLHFLKKGSVYMHNTYMYIWNWDVELSHLPMVKVLLHFSHVSFKTFKERSLWIHQKMSGNLNTSRHWLMWNYKENILKWFKFNSFIFQSLI